MTINLNDPNIMSAQTAAQLWGVNPSYVRISYHQNPNKFPVGSVRKFGNQWIVTTTGMEAITHQPDPRKQQKAGFHMTQHEYEQQLEADILRVLPDYRVENKVWNDPDEFIDFVNDKLFASDAVTGNGSGSYYFNANKAKQMVLANMDDVVEAFEELDDHTLQDKLTNGNYEAIDVITRCYFLDEAANVVASSGQIKFTDDDE